MQNGGDCVTRSSHRRTTQSSKTRSTTRKKNIVGNNGVMMHSHMSKENVRRGGRSSPGVNDRQK